MSKDHVRPTGFVYDDIYLRHITGAGHPECPQRLEVIVQGLRDRDLLGKLARIAPVPVQTQWLQAIHEPAYIELVRREVAAGPGQLSTGDTMVCPETYEVALAAAGGCVAAVGAVCAGKVHNAFCAVRPPGHHATPSRGMGFCVFNNAAIAARYAQKAHGVRKVLIVDWDLHHGNGTQEVFYDDVSVFYCSLHQNGEYPMSATSLGHSCETGRGEGAGTNLNIPLPCGAGDREFTAAVEDRLTPAAQRFRPDLLIISAGFDSRRDDPLGALAVSDQGFARLTELVTAMAPPGKTVSILEGGYNLATLGGAVAAHVQALMQR